MTYPAYVDCWTCLEYGERRMAVVVAAVVETRRRTDETPQQIVDRYMTGVHARHLAGLSLAVTA